MHLFIQLLPHELSGITTHGLDPKLVQLIFELGTFRERMGVTFEVEPVSTRVLKVEYPDENTFIVLRLGYGERFTDWKEPEMDAFSKAIKQAAAHAPKPRSNRHTDYRRTGRDDWTAIKNQMSKRAMWESEKAQVASIAQHVPDPREEEASMTLYRRLMAKLRAG